MIIETFKPSGVLSKYIDYYWILETGPGEQEVTERVIPMGNIQLMFHYKTSFKVNKSDGTSFIQPQSFISGLSSAFSDVTAMENSGMIAVVFFPYSACHFFDFPLHLLEEQTINLEDIYKDEPLVISDKLYRAGPFQSKIEILETFLFQKLTTHFKNNEALIKTCVNIINFDKGGISPHEVASKVNMSTKNLERKFAAFIGKTPKQYI